MRKGGREKGGEMRKGGKANERMKGKIERERDSHQQRVMVAIRVIFSRKYDFLGGKGRYQTYGIKMTP